MSLTISIPNAHPGRTVHAGIPFVDGVAIVSDLATGARAFFDAIGADIRDTPVTAPTSPADVHARTIAGVRALADAHHIELPARGKHDDLAATVAGVLFPEE